MVIDTNALDRRVVLQEHATAICCMFAFHDPNQVPLTEDGKRALSHVHTIHEVVLKVLAQKQASSSISFGLMYGPPMFGKCLPSSVDLSVESGGDQLIAKSEGRKVSVFIVSDRKRIREDLWTDYLPYAITKACSVFW